MINFSRTKQGCEMSDKYYKEYWRRFNMRKRSLPNNFELLGEDSKIEAMMSMEIYNRNLEVQIEDELNLELSEEASWCQM